MLIGVTVFLVVVMPYLKEINMRIIFIKFPLFMIFALFVTTSYSEGRYWNPLMKEKIITGAWAHREAIFHASISEMIKTYNVVSTGIDGLVPLHYHIFSHFLYGSVSGLLKTNSINFYNIVVPIIFIPLFFLSFVWCVNEVRGYYTRKYNYKIINEYYNSYWITLIVVFAFQDAHYNYPTAGSHGTALLLTFILIATTFRAVNKIKPESKPIAQTSDIILIIFVVICYLCISYSKISFIYLIGICYGYLFIRLKLYNSLFHKLTILGFCLVVIFMYLFLIAPFKLALPEVDYSKNIGLFGYYKSIFPEYLFSIYPSIVYILLKLFCLRINSVLILFKNVHNANLIDIELLIILMIMSFVPPYPHFHLMQMSIASILLLSHLGLFQERLFGLKRQVLN